ncbi:hypothetical protein CASFOL_007964 [Castilleja foliolosa]|uniref:Ycf2 N-terminal domain-containing protein n=2 Tax=Castilleja foliolosa TaxID=1961234 RepID=A0ABD3E205_9LAMI
MKKQKQKSAFCFLTVWGMEAELPFGLPRKRVSFFKPIFTEFNKKIGKVKKKYFGVLPVFKGKTKILGKHSKEAKKWVMKSVVLKTKKIKEFSKVNPILLFRLRKVEIYESREVKEEKDSLRSNQIIHESLSQIASPSRTNYAFTEKKMKDLDDRTSTILNQIDKISTEKKKVTTRINNRISANKTNYNLNRFEKWQLLKRRNARIICKLPFFLKFFIERIYTDIFLSSINIPKMNTKLFLEFKKKMIDKSIYNNSRKQEIINKKKKNPILFISKSLHNISNSKTNSHHFYDLSAISQAYVFYKLSQIQVSNSYKLRSVLHYQGIPFFPKLEIKDYFETRGVVHSKLGDKKLPSYEMNQWKNWLREHYQYNLSQIKWSRLIPEKWRNALHKHHIAKKEIVSKRHSYEKDPLIDSNTQFEVYSLSNPNENFQKYYRYDLLSYKFLDYEKKTECFFYRSPFQGNKNQGVSYTSKEALLDMPRNIPINNYLNNNLGRVDTLYIKKVADRKYFDWNILNFYLKQKVDIEAWTMIDTNRNQNIQIFTKNFQIISKKDLSYLMIPEKNPPNSHKGFFDWMGMNEKILKQPISNLKSWFFPEFVLLSNVYKMKPWFIPSKLLLLNLNITENKTCSENKKINEKGTINSLIASKKKYMRIWRFIIFILRRNRINLNSGPLFEILVKHWISYLMSAFREKIPIEVEGFFKQQRAGSTIQSNDIENFQKYYRYDLLSYKFLDYEKKTECFFYRSPFQGNKNQGVSYTSKEALLDMPRNIPINNYLNNNLGRVDTLYIKKVADRKYFDWNILNFYLKQKVDIEAWTMIDTNRNQNIQIFTKNFQIISKKDLSYLMIPEKNPPNSHKGFFDWMGMNEKILKQPISNLKSWFFPEFVLLSNVYKMKPWFIPRND